MSNNRQIRDAIDRIQREGDGLDLTAQKDRESASVSVSGQKSLSESWSAGGAVRWCKDLGWSVLGALSWRPKK